ncbi:hypothetical protein GCM10007989_06450 [Devosia pacifica]|uniref:BioF2-like acetyltransferase domain-containing protein n=2 Tax=Devosia pacifica TaxID=1335967 RepID=A0A918RVQ9_9HYPH|nr:hypothetical protein GCM10007989_06450 [Devosia pacifica]
MFTRGALGVQTLETLGDPHSQYANMLCDPTEDPQALGATLIDGLQQNGNVDIALIRALPASSGLGGLLSQRSAIDAEANEAAILDLSQYVSSEAYTASLGKTQKRNRNRRRNHLARHGELLFEVLWPGDVDYRSYLSVCLEMKRRWLSETGRYSAGFALEGYEDFLARLEGNAEDLAGACLSVLKCGDRVVALELGFIRNRHYYAYIGGFDWDLGSHSPGKVQMDMTVCWLIDNGIVAYDLLGNAADYKQSWTNRTVPLVAHTIPFSLRGRIYAALWVRGLRPLAKRFYNRLPEAWRRLMVAGQTFGGLLIYV